MTILGPVTPSSLSTNYPDLALSGAYKVSRLLSLQQPLERRFAGVIAVLSSFMRMRRGAISLRAGDMPATPFKVIAAPFTAEGFAHPRQDQDGFPAPRELMDQVAATGEPLVIENCASHPAYRNIGLSQSAPQAEKVSLLAAPIKIDGEVSGIVSCAREWEGGMRFRLDADIRFLIAIANLIGQAIKLDHCKFDDRKPGDDKLGARAVDEPDRPAAAMARASGEPGAEARRRTPSFNGIVGGSQPIRALLGKIEAAARSNAAVLLRGETGTGKEVFAQAIHDCSPRAKAPFVKVNCAAIPESMIESELFGHEKGSFTGAIGQRKGRFELADRGTLFLDEIGEISPAFQAKLLRVLQEGEFERVGGVHTLKVDTRIICATNRNLEDAVAGGQFRADLYYRINVVTLLLPPLRERADDIPELARAFLLRFSHENHRKLNFAKSAIETLRQCKFPGNVRELENCVCRTATLAPDSTIVGNDFDCHHGRCLSAGLWKDRPGSLAGLTTPTPPAEQIAEPAAAPAPPPACPSPHACIVTHPEIVARQKLVEAMERAGWVQAKAARLLGLTPRQIGYALRKHDVDMKRI